MSHCVLKEKLRVQNPVYLVFLGIEISGKAIFFRCFEVDRDINVLNKSGLMDLELFKRNKIRELRKLKITSIFKIINKIIFPLKQ